MTDEPNALQTPRTSFGTFAWAAALAALAGFAAVYVTLRSPDNGNSSQVASATQEDAKPATSATSQTQSLPSGPGTNPLSVGQMAAFVFKKSPEALPGTSFIDASGKERSLGDWRGLDRLQGEMGSDKFDVVAVSVDKTGIEGAKKFLDQIKVEKLGVFADPSVRLGNTLKAIGMPTTLLIDREGREIGRLVGPAEWDSEEAKHLIGAALR